MRVTFSWLFVAFCRSLSVTPDRLLRVYWGLLIASLGHIRRSKVLQTMALRITAAQSAQQDAHAQKLDVLFHETDLY